MNIVLYPNAKINIGLRIVEKRNDGFHNLETFFYPIRQLTDILEIIESDRMDIHYYGIPYSLPGNDIENDLCVKAFRLLEKGFGIPPVEIYLYKKIPAGSGLGGGSSDAANMLSGLNQLFNLRLNREELAAFASELGSDCPFFIYNEPMTGSGKGDILKPFISKSVKDLAERCRIRIYPQNIKISTAEAYSNIMPDPSGRDLKEKLSLPIEEWREHIVNDFEKNIFKMHPELNLAKQRIYDEGAIYASMSGSGSALYGIFLTD